MFIFRILNTVPYTNRTIVKDVIACVHSYFTCNLLIGLAILLSYKQFGGYPIECMTPMGFSSAWNEYAENYCFATETYYIPFKEAIENYDTEDKREKHISYYQWMSFFLLFQAACFKLPSLIWKYFSTQSGMRVGEILRLASHECNSDPNVRIENINSLCEHLQKALGFHKRLKKRNLTPHKICRFLNLKYSSHYVSIIYMFCKFGFFLNAMLQFGLLNKYLFGNRSGFFGYDILKTIITRNATWDQSGIFPRVTWCDFEVREMGQTQNHTVQCVLVLNIFTEKIFIVLWLWYMFLVAITICNLTSWLYTFLNDPSIEHFIYIHLEMSGQRVFSNNSNKGLKDIQIQVNRFTLKYLKSDGILMLRLISQHADIVFTTELIYKLWQTHYAIERQRETLKETENIWQDHLRRFEAIEEREKYEDDDASFLKESIELIKETNLEQLPVTSSSFVKKDYKKKKINKKMIKTKNAKIIDKNNRIKRFIGKHKSFKRTLSAEDLNSVTGLKRPMEISSSEDETTDISRRNS